MDDRQVKWFWRGIGLGVLLGMIVTATAGYIVFSRVPMGSMDFPLVGKVDELQSDVKTYMSGSNAGVCTRYDEVYQLLNQQFYYTGDIQEDKMSENALKGYIDALGDPYTTYFSTEENKSFNEEMQWSKNFEGIWAVIQKKDDAIMIEEIIKWGPAFKIWLQPLDQIAEISWESTQNMTVNDAVEKIRWPKWTSVDLTVIKAGSWLIEKITVIRDAISIPSVSAERFDINSKQIVYIELSIFGEDTKDAFEQAVRESGWSDDVDGVILDLRGNGGGYLPKAVDIASFFLKKWATVTTAKYRAYPPELFRSEWYMLFQNKPVVVLTDGMTASASEILAAALREDASAKLVGQKTFGKGSIQTVHDLEDGSSIKLTVGRRYTPSDNNVDKVGLIPDVEIAFDKDAYASGTDVQLEKAKEVIATELK